MGSQGKMFCWRGMSQTLRGTWYFLGEEVQRHPLPDCGVPEKVLLVFSWWLISAKHRGPFFVLGTVTAQEGFTPGKMLLEVSGALTFSPCEPGAIKFKKMTGSQGYFSPPFQPWIHPAVMSARSSLRRSSTSNNQKVLENVLHLCSEPHVITYLFL